MTDHYPTNGSSQEESSRWGVEDHFLPGAEPTLAENYAHQHGLALEDETRVLATIVTKSGEKSFVGRADKQEALLAELRDQKKNETGSVDHASGAADQDHKLELSEQEQRALDYFAYHAANKRSAQIGDYTGEANFHTESMGSILKSLRPEVQAMARDYAANRFGDDQVAF